MKTEQEKLKKANGWVWESQWAASEWRKESWRDFEMYDGGDAQWSDEDYAAAQAAGISPITVNRTFPVVNMLCGTQAIERFDITAKGRTQKDGEIAQVMSEGIKFVMDQYDGEYLVSQAFLNQLVPGFGCLAPVLNQDPRKERVAIKQRPWAEIWWDPFGPVWWDPERTKYVYWQRWVDLDDFQDLFHGKKKEIKEAYRDLSGERREYGYAPITDEAQAIEEKIRLLAASDWVDTQRERIRPVEMWYPVNELCLFALYADGRCYEISPDMNPMEAFQIVDGAQFVNRARVKKMRCMTFFGEHLLLQDIPSPYPHDQFPMVPFVGYVDRYGFPYGVPRQIRGQNEEVNKRRSMALAMLQKRRVIAERDVVPNGDEDALNTLYEEANKIDGFMVVSSGGVNKMKIEDLAQLSGPQIEIMRQSELEIREVAGTNAAALGYEDASQSGVAKQTDILRGKVTTATLFDNLRRSTKILGNQVVSLIQGAWKYEKVLRVTDRLTGAEKFVTVNEHNGVEVKNNITQGKFDIVISEVQNYDTIREKNMDLLYTTIEKSPPEAAPTLFLASLEMSDIPNKEAIIEKLKPILGLDPEEENQDPEEVKARILQEVKARKEQESMQAQLAQEAMQIELNKKKLENLKIQAEIQKLEADTNKSSVEAQVSAQKVELEADRDEVCAYEKGFNIGERINGTKGADQTGRN